MKTGLRKGLMKNTTMYDILVSRLPGIKSTVMHIGEKNCPYKIAAFFAAYTKGRIDSGSYAEIKMCFDVAEALLHSGLQDYRSAIENVYLFSVSRSLDAIPDLKNMLPLHIKKAYEKLNYSVRI